MGTLYIVGTPIGNLEDITLRGSRVLGEVGLIAAEDTRVTRRLLRHLQLRVPLTSYHKHNWQTKIPSLLLALDSFDVALVTDAGMPGISDPGCELVARAAASGFPVEAVPGSSAVTTAMAVSGLPADEFLFLGFLPRRIKERQAKLRSVAVFPQTIAIFEAPHRVQATLKDLFAVLGDREITVCRELTKFYEEVFRGVISQAQEHFTAPRGEFVLVVAGATPATESQEASVPTQEHVIAQLIELRESGLRAKEAVPEVMKNTGLPKKAVYQLWLDIVVGRDVGSS